MKDEADASIVFIGGVKGITGSCFLLQTKKAKILIDCGIFQGERLLHDENFADFNFDPKTIDAVLVTHAHYDHTGRIPLLISRGFSGKVYMTTPTKALTKIILEDAAHIMADNAKRNGDSVLYTHKDVEALDRQSIVFNYYTEFEVAPGLLATFYNAGHILGSACIQICVSADCTKDGVEKRIFFSGDIGNEDIPILPHTDPIEKADIVICESTYGNRDHEAVDERSKKLKDVIIRIVGVGGTLIIPAFSIERTQELLYEIDGLVDSGDIPKVPIFLDSPLAIKATRFYKQFSDYLKFKRDIGTSEDKDFFNFPRLRITQSVEESKTINNHFEAKIIIAGSGMMTGGRVMHHLKRYLPDKKSGVLIIGFQAEGTLGRKIFNGEKVVQIHNEPVEVRADISAIGAFSAHADRNTLARWLVSKHGSIKTVFLTHGDPLVKAEFKTFLEKKINSEIIVPDYRQVFDI